MKVFGGYQASGKHLVHEFEFEFEFEFAFVSLQQATIYNHVYYTYTTLINTWAWTPV